ncbi:MAG: acyl-CoA dehydrogenase family protein [Actinomycetota bacterium]
MSVTRVIADSSVAERAGDIAERIAGPQADDVDARARFPQEAIDGLREQGLLAALIPTDLGGGGATLADMAAATEALGRHCASTAMIFAMHQIQVACLVQHGSTPHLRDLQREIATDGLLLASATTEVGIGGDVRSSLCAVVHGEHYSLTKQAPVISYGAYADIILATARRTPDSPANDQSLVVCRRDAYTLEATGVWDTLGFRGTCSPGFVLRADGPPEDILPEPFGDISARTMLPTAHILWASVWLGLAGSAVETARRFVRSQARKQPGVVPPSALRLAELMSVYQQMSEIVHGAVRRYTDALADPDQLSSLGFAISMNSVKTITSTLVVDVVSRCLLICGIVAYSANTPYSLGRHLRDAHGAALMVNNDRILQNTSQMLLVHKD